MQPTRKGCPANSCEMSDEELKQRLTPEQYRIVRENGTERPFKNAYWNNKEPGIYVDIVSGEALFSSLDKFDSGTGWPSFTRPLTADAVVEREDVSLTRTRTEVRSKDADSHLGHVFDDGPAPTGRRYCINSSALRFIPAHSLAQEGYGQFVSLFAREAHPRDENVEPARIQEAVFGAGCFWGVEEAFAKAKGVVRTEVGYAGGTKGHPSYEEVKTGTTGHAESVRIEYDPSQTSFEELVRLFFAIHDPTTPNRQGPDHGTQYRSVIFYATEEDRRTAERIMDDLTRRRAFDKPIVTQLAPAATFWRAEEYHQDFLAKHGQTSCRR